jgi:centrosomal protein CEP104
MIYILPSISILILIAERVELWLHYSSKLNPSTPSSQNFEYVGFISLSDNSSTNFQSRELQSVSITPKLGSHLKLRFSSPYQNCLNPHNQLSILAINILGERFNNSNDFENIQVKSSSNSEQSENISICDDLGEFLEWGFQFFIFH